MRVAGPVALVTEQGSGEGHEQSDERLRRPATMFLVPVKFVCGREAGGSGSVCFSSYSGVKSVRS